MTENQEFYAHISVDKAEPNCPEKWRYQTVEEHCRQTAQYARETLQDVGLSSCAELAGLLHDMGKFKEEFQTYLMDSVSKQNPPARGSVNHTFAAVRFLLNRYHDGE